jgi:hypothetical protein
VSVAVSDIRENVHCMYQCGPDGSSQDCKGMGLEPAAWCLSCNFLASLPEDGVLYDNNDIAEMEAGEDW